MRLSIALTAVGIDAADAPSLFAAVEQQLGLKLEVRKGPVEIIAINHAESVPIQN